MTRFGDGLFTETWGHKSLHTAEILTTLSQAYDLLLGTNFPNNISADEILANEFALPFWDWWRASLFISIGNTQSARDLLKRRIDGKLKRLRDLTYLHTHIWDLAESPNISMRNAGAPWHLRTPVQPGPGCLRKYQSSDVGDLEAPGHLGKPTDQRLLDLQQRDRGQRLF